jgi:subtilisin family serine protease
VIINGELSQFANVIVRDERSSQNEFDWEIQVILTANLTTPDSIIEGEILVVKNGQQLTGSLPVTLRITPPNASVIPTENLFSDPSRIVTGADGLKFMKGEVIIALADDDKIDDLKILVANLDGGFLGGIEEFSLYNIVLPDNLDQVSINAIMDELNNVDYIDAATPSFVGTTFSGIDITKDPEYLRVDPLDEWREDIPVGPTAPFEYAGFPATWELYGWSSTRIRIGVIDDSFDINHEDLAANIVLSRGQNFDRLTHGTKTAGLIAAKPQNNKGVAGVISKTNLYTYSVNSPLFGTDIAAWNVAGAIKDARNDGVNIVNMSFGLNIDSTDNTQNCMLIRNPIYSAPINLAILKSKKILFVVAAGNNQASDSSCFPASLTRLYDNVISVSSLDTISQGTSRIEWNPKPVVKGAIKTVDVLAPSCFLLPLPNDKYTVRRACGSSYSAPMVTGLAGLMLKENPSLTPKELKELIIRSAEEQGAGTTTLSGHPFDAHAINARRALELAGENDLNTKRVEIKATGTVFNFSQDTPMGISIGDEVAITIAYDTDKAGYLSNAGAFKSGFRFWFSDSSFAKMTYQIGSNTWRSKAPRTSGNQFILQSRLDKISQFNTSPTAKRAALFFSASGEPNDFSILPSGVGESNSLIRLGADLVGPNLVKDFSIPNTAQDISLNGSPIDGFCTSFISSDESAKTHQFCGAISEIIYDSSGNIESSYAINIQFDPQSITVNGNSVD